MGRRVDDGVEGSDELIYIRRETVRAYTEYEILVIAKQ